MALAGEAGVSAPLERWAEYRGQDRKEEPCPQLNPTLLSTPPRQASLSQAVWGHEVRRHSNKPLPSLRSHRSSPWGPWPPPHPGSEMCSSCPRPLVMSPRDHRAAALPGRSAHPTPGLSNVPPGLSGSPTLTYPLPPSLLPAFSGPSPKATGLWPPLAV